MSNLSRRSTATFLRRKPVASISDYRCIASPAGETMDLIFIEGFEGETVIGIDKDELNRPQRVLIDLVAGVPHSRACETDRVGDTIDYGAVYHALTSLLAAHKVKMLEALAETITSMLIEKFGAHWARVAVVKPGKFANVRSVGVVIERRRFGAKQEDPSSTHEDASVSYLPRQGLGG